MQQPTWKSIVLTSGKGIATLMTLSMALLALGGPSTAATEATPSRGVTHPHFVVQAKDPQATVATIQTLQRVLRKRLQAAGFENVSVERQGLREIVVEVPDATESARVKVLISRRTKLEFQRPAAGNSTGWVSAGLDGRSVVAAQPSPDLVGWGVTLTLDKQGTERLLKLTTELQGQQLAVAIDGKVVTKPQVEAPITSGTVRLGGHMKADEARDLAAELQGGALPVDVTVKPGS